MAALTDTLANASSSRRVIDPGGGGPSWTEGLANLAKGLVGQGSQLYEQNQAEQRRTAAQTAAAQEASAANAASQLVFDQRLGRGEFAPVKTPGPTPTAPDPYPNNAPIDASLEGAPPPPGVERIVNETTRARAAEDQQRAPAGSTDIILERNLSRLLAQYPDQVNNIRKIFQDAGFDHYLFRESETEEALFQAERAGSIKMTQDYANEAVSNGLVMPGTDMQTAALVGQQSAHQAYLFKKQADAIALASAEGAEQRAQFSFTQEQTDREVTQNFAAGMSSALQGPLSQLRNIFTQANGDQSVLDLIPETLNALDTVAFNWISAARQGGAPESTIKAMEDQWARQRPLIVDLVSGPGSELGVAESTLKSMTTNLGIDMMTALPTYYGLKEIFGASALADFAANMPQELRDTMVTEMKGIQGAIDTDGERVSVANIAQMLRGELNITEMNEAQARTAMPTIIGVARGQTRDMASGRGNPQSYVNSNLQITNAALELQPGNQQVKSESLVAGTIFTAEARRVDLELMRTDPQSGQLLVNSKRAAARHVLRNTATDRWMSDPWATNNGLWSAHYDQANGRWITRITDQGYNNYLRNLNQSNAQSAYSGGSIGTPGGLGLTRERPRSREELFRQGPPEPLAERVGSVNLSLDYLVETNQFDEDFRGVSAIEARRLFLTGAVPAAMQQRVQAQTSDGMSLAQQIEGYRTNLDEARVNSEQGYSNARGSRAADEAPLPRDALQNMVRDKAEAFGLDWNDVHRLVSKESSWDSQALNTTTNAAGLFQINDDVRRSVPENIDKGLNMFKDALDGARRIVGPRATAADGYVMYQQGAGGGAALLNPRNASRKAEDVLAEVYPSRATARQAITANGGNLNMTAAQFAQSIRNYFNS